MKLSPNLRTPPDVATWLLSRLPQAGRQSFVDAGCGSGELLLRVARARPQLACHGLELSPTLSAGLRTTFGQAGLPNLTLHEADLRHALDVVPEADFIFAYVGGAMHQALAIHLAERCFQGTLLSALYPCYPFAATRTQLLGGLATYEYEFPACHTQLVWDAPAAVSLTPAPGYALLSRAARFGGAGSLSVHIEAPAALRGCVEVHLGQPVVVPGQILMLDIIVDTSQLPEPPEPAVVTIDLACAGVALWPAHTLVVGYHPREAVELALPAEADEALLHSVRARDFTTFYQLLATYQESMPAVQHYASLAC